MDPVLHNFGWSNHYKTYHGTFTADGQLIKATVGTSPDEREATQDERARLLTAWRLTKNANKLVISPHD